MEKNADYRWQRALGGAILYALFLPCTVCAGGEVGDPGASARSAVGPADRPAAAEQRCIELEAALARAERDSAALQRRFAELYLESHDQAQQLEQLRLRIAGLLSDHQDVDKGRAFAEVLAYLDTALKDHLQLYSGVREFGRHLETVLDVLEPSAGVRRETTERFAALLKLVDRLERMPSLVAGRGGETNRERREGRILAVNDELQLVVLDVGSADGVRPGTEWDVVDGTRVVGRLKIIESRPGLSAAVSISGSLREIAPGMQARAAVAQAE